MEEKEYETLLDEAYAQLPEVLYKSERFEVPKVSGRLIKSRTVVNNFRELAKHFSRSEDHFSKYMLRDLGVRGEVDMRGELVLHSRFQPAMLNKAVENYFKIYVKCEHCNSPDTEMSESETEIRCKACGHVEKVARL